MFVFGGFFTTSALIPTEANPLIQTVYADEDDEQPDEGEANEDDEDDEAEETTVSAETICSKESGAVAWALCSVMQASGKLVDGFYNMIEQFLIVEPISTDKSSATYLVWDTIRNITNIIFIIFALIIIYSQLTGLGIDNYGIKRTLPRLIVAAILVNLSYFISSVAVDISNVIGASLTGFLDGVQNTILSNANVEASLDVSWSDFTQYLTLGVGTAAIAFIAAGGAESILWAVGLALVGAIISLGIGLATIALRQGVIILLVMISPLAFVAYLLPNTEKWFEKWKQFFFQMLVFYPAFSLLFGASKLAGWSVIAAADKDPIKILIGLAVQVMPIFFAFSLFKMSGNALGAFNAGLQKLSTPLRDGLNAYGNSHRDLARAKYLGNQYTPGGKLRGYLDYRKALREADTEKANELRKNRALERANKKSASYLGLDEEGRSMVGSRLRNGYANSHSRLHKKASLYATRAAAAQQLLDNNLSEYGDAFKGKSAKRLSAAHAHAFEDTMKEQFRAENIAQGDQSYLLNRYLDAAKDRYRSPYEFNRLIGGAVGTTGHYGEATIIGQVIDRSVQIETRRRREALVVANKFGYSKTEFRSMAFDKARINDDGFEEDEYGQVIEDKDYRIMPGKKHRQWDKYIGVHKDTNKEITKEEYDALSSGERANYRKVRYMEIRDDAGDAIQRVYEDDAGYMKEMLTQDIAIGDPINMRYLTEIGLARPTTELTGAAKDYAGQEKTGILRRYHSTITAAMLASRYGEHNAAVTAMLTAQANNGFITSVGQYRLAELDSLWKAAKSGKILQNDAVVINSWIRLINSLNTDVPGERFEDIITDADLALNRNVNGLDLHGLRQTYDANGNITWEKIDRNDPSITVAEKREWIRRRVIPEVERKVLGSVDRNPSPNILDSQKPDSTKAFFKLADAIADDNIARYEKMTPEEQTNFESLLDTKNPYQLRQHIGQRREEWEQIIADQTASDRKSKDGVPLGNHEKTYFDKNGGHQSAAASFQQQTDLLADTAKAILKFTNALNRSQKSEDYYATTNDPQEIITRIRNIFEENPETNYASLSSMISQYAHENETLRLHAYDIDNIIGEVDSDPNYIAKTTGESINQITDSDYDQPKIAALQQQLDDFLNNILFS